MISSGKNITHTVPIYEGVYIADDTLRLDIGGENVTDHLIRMLIDRGYSFYTSAEKLFAIDIKEKLCYVSTDYDTELCSEDLEGWARKYQLPDGEVINVGVQRFRAPECLFRPSMVGMSAYGVHQMTYESIKKCDESIRKDLYENILLAGGNTLLHASTMPTFSMNNHRSRFIIFIPCNPHMLKCTQSCQHTPTNPC